MAQIILDHVEKAYAGGVKAINDLSLDIADGEFMVFVGPSGCGKSTALRSIAGLEEITGGTITIGDRVVNDLPPKDRDIAMVFQNYALYPHMTVEQNLAFGPHVEHASIAEAAEASEDEATAALVGGKSLWTARVSKESRVKHGGPLELAVDTRYLQFFDPASGLSIGHPQATAALAD
jgi:ABC-type Fe3+/spermidine/putrescine transport system ATPase subunit